MGPTSVHFTVAVDTGNAEVASPPPTVDSGPKPCEAMNEPQRTTTECEVRAWGW